MFANLTVDGLKLPITSFVLCQGAMAGTAILFPAISSEAVVHRWMTLAIFAFSVSVYVKLRWEAVIRHFPVSFTIVAVLVVVMLPHTDVSFPFLVGRLPLLVTFVSWIIERFSRSQSDNGPVDTMDRMVRLGPFGCFDRHRRLEKKIDSQRHLDMKMSKNETKTDAPLNQDEPLLGFMEGGLLPPPSKRSSDLSLSSVGLDSLPLSWDSRIRKFFQDSSCPEDGFPEDRPEYGDTETGS